MSIAKILDQTIPLVSGYSMRSQYITDSLTKLGVKLDVFSAPQFTYPAAEEVYQGVEYFRSRVWGWPVIKNIPFLRQQAIIKALECNLEKNWSSEIKLIHAHSPVLNAIAGIKIARKRRVPFVYEVRALWEDAAVDQGKTTEKSLRYKLTRDAETKLIKKADKVTVICEGLKKDIVSRGIPEEKIVVVPNGVDTDLFKPASADEALKQKLGLAGYKVIGYVGTLFLFEGIEILIEAANELLKDKEDVKFLIVGSGIEEKRLRERTAALRLSDKVIFTGIVKHSEVAKYYSVIDVLVYPRVSKRITELVTPLKPLEAMAQEKLVIASDVGGLKELVEDNVTGVLFKAGDYTALAEKCKYVLDNWNAMQKIAAQSREFVIRERNWMTICGKYVEIYKSLGAL